MIIPLMSAFHIWQRMKSAINVFHIKRMKSFCYQQPKYTIFNGIHNGEILHLPIIYSKFMPKSGFDWIHDIFPPHYVFQFYN